MGNISIKVYREFSYQDDNDERGDYVKGLQQALNKTAYIMSMLGPADMKFEVTLDHTKEVDWSHPENMKDI